MAAVPGRDGDCPTPFDPMTVAPCHRTRLVDAPFSPEPGPDVKPEEKIYDSEGNLIDENYIERAVEDVHRQLGPGRPSLTAPGRISPEIKARVPVELKDRLQQAAKEHGKPLSVFIREALEQYLDEAS